MPGTPGERENNNGCLSTYRWNGDGNSPSVAIIRALADLQDAAPASLDALYDSIDPGALDRLLSNEKEAHVVVEFRRGDYLITVDDDGEIRIRDADDSEE